MTDVYAFERCPFRDAAHAVADRSCVARSAARVLWPAATRAERVEVSDEGIEAWTLTRTTNDALEVLREAKVPAGRAYTAKDIVEDPHYRDREMVLKQETRDGYEVDVPGVVPKLLGTPGSIRSSAPRLGDDTDAVLGEIGFSAQDVTALRARNVVA